MLFAQEIYYPFVLFRIGIIRGGWRSFGTRGFYLIGIEIMEKFARAKTSLLPSVTRAFAGGSRSRNAVSILFLNIQNNLLRIRNVI